MHLFLYHPHTIWNEGGKSSTFYQFSYTDTQHGLSQELFWLNLWNAVFYERSVVELQLFYILMADREVICDTFHSYSWPLTSFTSSTCYVSVKITEVFPRFKKKKKKNMSVTCDKEGLKGMVSRLFRHHFCVKINFDGQHY